MPDTKTIIMAVLLVLAVAAIAGCTGTSSTSTPTPTAEVNVSANNPAPSGGGQSGGTPPGGTPTGGNSSGGQGAPSGISSSSSSYTYSGAYSISGTTATESDKTITASGTNESGVYASNGANLTLVSPTITTSGDTTSDDDSSFYGLNAGVLATSGSTITITGGSISTTGTGANGAFATGTGSSIYLSGVTISATKDGGHGVDATLGGALTLDNVDITTSGAHGAALATDRGSGTITATGGTVTTSGVDSPGIYSTGVITVTGATITATGSEAAVVEGGNSINVTDSSLTAGKGTRDRAVMLYQSTSGDASEGTGSFTMTGGSLTWPSTTGPVFYVTNGNARISLKGVAIASSSPVLLNASADSWGTSGSNGGTVTFTAEDETLNGSILADDISSVTVTLQNGTTLTGALNPGNTAKLLSLSIDSTSTWNVTADSYLSVLSDAGGISGTSVTNIVGNGYNVYYDSSLSSNSALGGQTYTLVNGGQLISK
jgi:hypothetical protein